MTAKVESLVREVIWSREKLRESQLSDPDIGIVLRAREESDSRPDWGKVSPCSAATKTYWAMYEQLTVYKGVLYRRWESADGTLVRWQLILPRECRNAVMKGLHDENAGGHLGMSKTLDKVKQRYFWHGMSVDVRSWVRSCNICARKREPGRRQRAPLQLYVVGSSMERIAIDVLGPFVETNSGNRKVLVVGDYFSKWMEAYPIPNEEATTIAKVLVYEFFSKFGVPYEIHSDRGRNFISSVFAEVCKLFGADKTYTTPRHPQGDGMVERFNHCLVSTVKSFMDPLKNMKDWDQHLPLATMAYRSSVHPSTGETPNMLVLGKEVTLPIDLMFETETQESAGDYVAELRDRIRLAHDRAREQLKTSTRTYKRYYDRNVIRKCYKPGEFVWLKDERRRKGYSPKLQFAYEGPYMVVNRLTDVVYRIQRGPRAKFKVVHFEKLKRYEGESIPGWLDKVNLLPLDKRQQANKPDGPLDLLPLDLEKEPSERDYVEQIEEEPEIATPLEDKPDDSTEDKPSLGESLPECDTDDSLHTDMAGIAGEDTSKVRDSGGTKTQAYGAGRYPARERKQTQYYGFRSLLRTKKNGVSETPGEETTQVEGKQSTGLSLINEHYSEP